MIGYSRLDAWPDDPWLEEPWDKDEENQEGDYYDDTETE